MNGIKDIAGLGVGAIAADSIVNADCLEFGNKISRIPTPRKQIIKRDNGLCQKCGRMDSLEVHHIVPVCEGGSNEKSNLITFCSGCHIKWHSVEKVSVLSMAEWVKYPPTHRLILLIKEIVDCVKQDNLVEKLTHILDSLKLKKLDIDKKDRKTIKNSTSIALRYKKLQGHHIGSPAYGFEMVEKRLVEFPKEQKAILFIQQMKADGANLQAIANELNNQGIITKRGAKWQPMQVSRVLARG